MQFVAQKNLKNGGVSWTLHDVPGVQRVGGLYTLLRVLPGCKPAALQVMATRLDGSYVSTVSARRQPGIWPHQQQAGPLHTASLQEAAARVVRRARGAHFIRCLFDLLGVSGAAEAGMSLEQLVELAGSEVHRSRAEPQLLWALQTAADLAGQPASEAPASAQRLFASHCPVFLQLLEELLPLDSALASLQGASAEQLYDAVSCCRCGRRLTCGSPVGRLLEAP